eukprot:TRINITY_DN1252_c0_g1_i5.p1 TRINITY_DN1252_c0_g1~~TRINITY_DN1252_c0_g1_i5.p1  ORF type:complete len:111 (+),score=40.52 TRINITY_DN1252_c0_g1_i5:42-335(+)
MTEEKKDPKFQNQVQNFCSACPPLKIKYEQCFQRWYSEVYLKYPDTKTLGCEAEFKEYQECVLDNIKKKGLGDALATIEKVREKERNEALQAASTTQ